MDPRSVTVMVDGVERARLDLAKMRELQIEVEAGASLIEVRGQDDRGDVLLATHVISYSDNLFQLSRGKAALSRGRLGFAVEPIADLPDRVPRATLSLDYAPRFQWDRPWTVANILEGPQRAIRWYALTGLAVALISWGAARLYYGHRIKTLENKLQQARGHQHPLPSATARAILSYMLTRDDLRVRSPEGPGIPEIPLRLHSAAIGLELPIPRTTGGQTYSAELGTFAGDKTLLTLNFLQATRTDSGSSVEIVVPSELLRANDYYTVHVRSTDTTYHFTFKVVASE